MHSRKGGTKMTTNEMATREETKIMTNGRGKGLIATGLLVTGGLIGATLGILYAPRSGRETREEIRHSAEGLAKKAKGQYDGACQRIVNMAGRQKESIIVKKEKLKKALECGVEALK